ncbi:hypothetical protein B0H11DRAFT_493450 [Mycena galericulata]|nr:hypothetical protein B0H11DRAFT_493450 [Mycena galericulata]
MAVVCMVCNIEGRDTNHIFILEINLETDHSRNLFHLAIDWSFPSHLEISGDFFACSLLDTLVLLVNWRNEGYIIFDSVQPTFHLFRGYIIIASSLAPFPRSTDTVALYSISSLDALLCPVSSLTATSHTEVKGIPSVAWSITNDHPIEKSPTHHVGISVFESALHDQTYEFAIEVLDYIHASESVWMRTLSRYRFTPGSAPVSAQELARPALISTLRHSTHYICPSAAGYGLSWNGLLSYGHYYGWSHLERVCVYRLDEAGIKDPQELPLGDWEPPRDVQMSQSGALMALYPSRVVVSYYV